MLRLKSVYLTLFVGIVFATTVKACLQPFVYKFGDDKGTQVYTADGTILPFVYVTTKRIEVPIGMEVTYVEVKVYSISPPKVDYDNISRTVTIHFALTQMTLSKYEIFVKAMPVYSAVAADEIIAIDGLA